MKRRECTFGGSGVGGRGSVKSFFPIPDPRSPAPGFPIPKSPPGFTLIELLLGLIVTTLVLAAVAAVSFAVAANWRQGQNVQSLQMQTSQTALRLQRVIGEAKFIGYVAAGSVEGNVSPAACIVLWQRDDWGGARDGIIQLGEIAVIQHDPAADRINLYEAIAASAMNSDQLEDAGTAVPLDDINQSNTPSLFKTTSFVAPAKVIGHGVAGMKLSVRSLDSTAERPSVEFTLKFIRGEQIDVQYGAATLRSPNGQPKEEDAGEDEDEDD